MRCTVNAISSDGGRRAKQSPRSEKATTTNCLRIKLYRSYSSAKDHDCLQIISLLYKSDLKSVIAEVEVVSMSSYGTDRTLEETATWAVATVSAAFIIISLLMEHVIHKIGHMFQKRQKKAMSEALTKIKDELMVVGFISLILTVATKPITYICISKATADIMLPCKKKIEKVLDEADKKGCAKKGKVSLISYTALQELLVFLFVLAVFHVLYCVITIGLAQAKMKKWKKWEHDTTLVEHEAETDPTRFRLTHQISFIKRHTGLSTTWGIRWIIAVFRQFTSSVTKVDYVTLRRGFINAHFSPNSKFDFHKYIKRSMEDDFKVVVGISVPLWTFAVLFQLLNVYKWYTMSLIVALPLVLVLFIGAKLEVIIMDMAQEIRERETVVRGAPIVSASDKHFWFNRPRLVLSLIHFILFQNAFQMAYFLWTWYEFGLTSCASEDLSFMCVRVALGVVLQFVCSYITFPLYAFVTQMGSHMKMSIFEEQTANALKNWQKKAKDHKRLKKPRGEDISSSPTHLLQNYNTRSTMDIESASGTPRYHSDTEISEIEGPSPIASNSKKGEFSL